MECRFYSMNSVLNLVFHIVNSVLGVPQKEYAFGKTKIFIREPQTVTCYSQLMLMNHNSCTLWKMEDSKLWKELHRKWNQPNVLRRRSKATSVWSISDCSSFKNWVNSPSIEILRKVATGKLNMQWIHCVIENFRTYKAYQEVENDYVSGAIEAGGEFLWSVLILSRV